MVLTVGSLNINFVASDGRTTILSWWVPGETDIAFSSESGGDGLHDTGLVGGLLALNDEDLGVGAATAVASSDSVLDGPLIIENVVVVNVVNGRGHFGLADVLSGPEVNTSPSEVPEDLVGIGTVLTLPFECDGSDLSAADGGESSTAVHPLRSGGLSWGLIHVNIFITDG